MSSIYRVLCLSHDPAIEAADGNWNRPEPAEQAIADGIDGHTGCDLMIGRYSYPLVALGCPRSADTKGHIGSTCLHGSLIWVDAKWLRLLAVAQQDPASVAGQIAADGHFRCWTPERLRRLRLELGTAHLYLTPPEA